MQAVIQLFARIVSILLTALEIMMLLRAILSWLPLDEDSAFVRFLCFCTEPIILPFRKLTEHFPALYDLPIDMAFFFAVIALGIVNTLISYLPI